MKVRDDPIKHQMEHFGAVVRGEVQPLVSARGGLANLHVTEAIMEAAKAGRRSRPVEKETRPWHSKS